jgi:ParB family chromosome partitioning protein
MFYIQGTEIEARKWEISENPHRADLSALERAEHVAEWIRLTEEKSGASCATKPGAGRGAEGRLRAAVRELGIDRSEAQRAVKIAALVPEANPDYARWSAGLTQSSGPT